MIVALFCGNSTTQSILTEALSGLGIEIKDHLDDTTQIALVVEPVWEPVRAMLDQAPDTLAVLKVSHLPVGLYALVHDLEDAQARAGKRIGPWQFYPALRLLKHSSGAEENLTQKETEMLDYLLKAGGLVSKEELQSQVFGYQTEISTHTVETHIHTLRKKLGTALLLTEEAGYSLVVKI